jgi:pimeloyl-ACP methyl ester carboxylesterase
MLVMARIANGDLVVVIPGILGSVLTRAGRQTWGYRQVFRSPRHLTARLTDDLAFETNAFADPHHGTDDGTVATGMLTTLGIIPGFWTIDGYDELLTNLRVRFLTDRDAIGEFPYDWRQSNEYTARRLQRYVEPALDARRRAHPEARLVLIGHSMGGLVARYYAECLDTRKLTRRVVTIGTPYLGAAKALSVLANGHVELAGRRIDLGDLVRFLPSVAELLPLYPSWGTTPARLAALGTPAATVPGLPYECLARALAFHRRIRESITANGDQRPVYHALASHRQDTDTWAGPSTFGRVAAHCMTDFEDGGDGTVPRCSAVPPEWTDDAAAVYLPGRHAGLQQQRETLVQLHGILTAKARVPQAAACEIAVDAAPHTVTGEGWVVRARSVEGSNSLVLTAMVHDLDAGDVRPVAEEPLRPCGEGRYEATLRLREPGTYRWTVRTEPVAATPLDPVSDVVLCTPEE